MKHLEPYDYRKDVELRLFFEEFRSKLLEDTLDRMFDSYYGRPVKPVMSLCEIPTEIANYNGYCKELFKEHFQILFYVQKEREKS